MLILVVPDEYRLVQGLLYTILMNSKETKDEVNFLDVDTWPEILRQHLEDARGEEVRLRTNVCWCAKFVTSGRLAWGSGLAGAQTRLSLACYAQLFVRLRDIRECIDYISETGQKSVSPARPWLLNSLLHSVTQVADLIPWYTNLTDADLVVTGVEVSRTCFGETHRRVSLEGKSSKICVIYV